MRKTDYRTERKRLLVIAVPTVLVLIIILCVLFFYDPAIPAAYAQSLILSILLNIAYAYVIYSFLAPFLTSLNSPVKFVGVQFGFIILSALLYHTLLSFNILKYPASVINNQLPKYFLNAIFMIISATVFYGIWSIYLMFNTYTLSQKSYKVLMNDYQTEIRSLRLQMNPHYLSNSLTNLSHLIRSHDKQKALQYNQELIELLSEQLKYINAETISIQEEISWLEYYLQVEKNRLNKVFDYSIEIEDEQLYSVLIPPMLLQPLVENSINHGFNPNVLKRKGLLVIRVFRQNSNTVSIILEDNGIGNKASKNMANTDRKRKSVSLENIEKRIKLINEIGKYKIGMTKISSEEGTILEVMITESRYF